MEWMKRVHSLSKVLFALYLIQHAFLDANGIYRAEAQVVTAITQTPGAGALGTTVNQAGSVYNITGGTRAGTNLFHSFGSFSVGAADTANFLNTPINGFLPLTSNILGRVTGGNPSSIFGTIQTTGFGNANLFLMNPAGIVFGPNASLNVGGSVTFMTANNIRLTETGIFHADPALRSVLSSAPVSAFGFLGPNPAAIIVQGSQLSVQPSQSISLVGGDITIQAGTLADGTVQSAKLSAPGGQINLVSVAGPGEILASTYEPISAIAMGSINLSEGSVLDVSADAAGTIRIRGGQFVVSDATLSADTVNANGAPMAIDINVTGDLSITDTRGLPAITARATGSGNAGAIQITAGNLTATTTFLDPSFLPTTLLDTHTSGEGRGGDVSITTGNLTAMGTPEGGNLFTFIDSGTTANGRGGDVTISARTIDLNATTISTGQLNASAFVEDLTTVNGSAGHLTITADTVKTLDAILDTSALFGTSPLQTGGDITITAHDIAMVNTQVSSINTNGGGALTIKTDSLVADFTSFEIDTTSGPGGGISVEARVIELTNGSAMISSTLGEGNAGDIRLTATDHVSMIGDLGTNELAPFQPSGLFSNSFGSIFETFGGSGNAGNIIVTTPRLEMNAGRINTATSSSGSGGNVTLNVPGTISISGEFPSDSLIIPSIFDIGPRAPSGVVTSTVGGELCIGVCGNAGNISINTGSLSMATGSRIDSGTSSTGLGGDVTIAANNTISLSGTLSDGTPVGVFSRSIGTDPGSGSGGNIALTAGQSVTISDGASVSASSTGPGNAGNISINAGQQFEMRNSSVKTEAAQASGGNIDIQVVDRVRLVNSSISTSVLGGSGSGGNITIDPNVVVLQNSQVIAQAVQGAGGNITITTPLFLADSTSLVSASSQFGLNGTVTIQSPTSNLSGSLGTLSSKPSQAQSLLTQRCAALANGQASSFVVAGREQLPADPGGWLTSSLALTGIDAERFGDGIVAEGTSNLAPRTSGLLANDTVSLRRLTPAGFLIANFADSEATGCHS